MLLKIQCDEELLLLPVAGYRENEMNCAWVLDNPGVVRLNGTSARLRLLWDKNDRFYTLLVEGENTVSRQSVSSVETISSFPNPEDLTDFRASR